MHILEESYSKGNTTIYRAINTETQKHTLIVLREATDQKELLDIFEEDEEED